MQATILAGRLDEEGFTKDSLRWLVEGMTRDIEQTFFRASKENTEELLKRAKTLLGVLAEVDLGQI